MGDGINCGWLIRIMGLSPPAGSLSAALIACDGLVTARTVTGRKYHCRLTRSLQGRLPQPAFWRMSTALHLIWPFFMGSADKEQKSLLSFSAVSPQVVLAHPHCCFPSSGSSANVFMPSDMTVLDGVFQGAMRRIEIPPHLLGRLSEGVAPNYF